jgi:hypothetical protein
MACRGPEERTVLTGRGRVAVGALSLTVAGVLLAGCSGDPEPVSPSAASSAPTGSATASPSPTPTAQSVAEVYRAARTASLSAESGRAVGTVTSDGTRLRIDLEGTADGGNQTVFITTPAGGTAEVRTVGDGYWVGGDQAHWTEITGDATSAKALVGRYAPVAETDATELGSFTLRSILTDAFTWPDLALLESDTGEAPLTEVDGQPAYVLGQQGGARLWVAADGSGTLLRLVGPKSEPTDLTFSKWGRATTFTEPPPDLLIEN